MAFGACGDGACGILGGPVDLPRVLRMLIVHDLVEIDAGDTFAYDKEGNVYEKGSRTARC